MDILLIFPGFILAIITIVIYEIKLRKPKKKNKVRFYVAIDKNEELGLWFGKHYRGIENWVMVDKSVIIASGEKDLNLYGLNIDDYKDLKWEDESKEVFLNLED